MSTNKKTYGASLQAKYNEDVLTAGFTAIPNVILMTQKELGITRNMMWLYTVVKAFPPNKFISLSDLTNLTTISEKSLRRYRKEFKALKNLGGKQLVDYKEKREQKSDGTWCTIGLQYDFGKLEEEAYWAYLLQTMELEGEVVTDHPYLSAEWTNMSTEWTNMGGLYKITSQDNTAKITSYKEEEFKQDSKVGAMPPLESASNGEKPVSVKDQFRETNRFWGHFDQDDKAIIGKIQKLREISKDFQSDSDFEDLISTMHRKYDVVFVQEFFKAHVSNYPLESRTKKQIIGGIEKWYSTRMLKMKEKEIEKESRKAESNKSTSLEIDEYTVVPILCETRQAELDGVEFSYDVYKCTCGNEVDTGQSYCFKCHAKLNWESYKKIA